MFATIRRYQGKPGNTEEVIRRVQQGLIPMLTIQRGFVSYHAIDAGNDVAISVSIYADRAAAEAANQSATSWVKQNLRDLVVPGDVTVGEVRASATAARV
jgi:heme-degrading monooxygenase HmoA